LPKSGNIQKTNSFKSGDFGPFFQKKNPLYESHCLFFCCQDVKEMLVMGLGTKELKNESLGLRKAHFFVVFCIRPFF
jgi:hypothetical protein